MTDDDKNKVDQAATDEAENDADDSNDAIPFREFLEKTPPSKSVLVTGVKKFTPQGTTTYVATPDVELYCESDKCLGVRTFRCSDNTFFPTDEWVYLFHTYTCYNCLKTSHTFSLAIRLDENPKKKDGMRVGTAYKFGELPVFGPRIPSKLVSIAGRDREILLQGRRSEAQALGIGAFSYYRRVVEDRKSHLLDRIIKVVQKISPNDPIIQELEDAKKETQFGKAIDNIKSTFPQGLLINGENPLKLLHAALSQGIHNLSDDECLNLATSVRVVLSELIGRMDDLMKDENEVISAINNLKNTSKK